MSDLVVIAFPTEAKDQPQMDEGDSRRDSARYSGIVLAGT
jgi:hypothetical protein